MFEQIRTAASNMMSYDKSQDTKDKDSISKKPWTEVEDEKLRALVVLNGTGNWTAISEILPERTGKQCRERWYNHLNPEINKSDFTPEEDRVIMNMQKAFGNQWAKVKNNYFDLLL
jgi:hypothetical protein